jgi:hypothetical protein
LSARSFVSSTIEVTTMDRTAQCSAPGSANGIEGAAVVRNRATTDRSSLYRVIKRLSLVAVWRKALLRLRLCSLGAASACPGLAGDHVGYTADIVRSIHFLQQSLRCHCRTFTICRADLTCGKGCIWTMVARARYEARSTNGYAIEGCY